MMSRKIMEEKLKFKEYVEELNNNIKKSNSIVSLLDIEEGEEKISWKEIPDKPGILAICRIPDYNENLWFKTTNEANNNKKQNLEWINPLVMYIGESSNLRNRMRSHFTLNKHEDVGNSIFQKVLVQMIGDWRIVKENILRSKNTTVTWITLPEDLDKKQREEIKRQAIEKIKPRLNF